MSYQPFDYRPQEKNTFYVSRAYNSDFKNAISADDVFVYGVENDDVFLINSFTNVRPKLTRRLANA
mgnify:CR=1 FL=1